MVKRRIIPILLAGILIALGICALADTGEKLLTLPVGVETVETEAFAGSGVSAVVITSGVRRIENRAFADCGKLTDVVLPNHDVEIADTAFAGCGDILFHAFAGTRNELWALSHGFRCETEDADVLTQTGAMLTRFGIPSASLQSENRDYATCRLIVRMNGERLPDISAYEPTDIVQAGRNRFFIQFDTIDHTRLCRNMLAAAPGVAWVEPDLYYGVMEPLVSQQGVAAGWYDDDPMGFGAYAAFVEQESTGTVKVAVLDSGFPANAAYDSMLLTSAGKSFSLDGKSWRVDGCSHGGTVTAVLAACAGNANVKILPVKIADGTGRVDTISLLMGLDYAAQQGVSLINLSVDYDDPDFTSAAIEDAIQHCGATVVAAAGNFGNQHSRTEYFPARLNGVISVGAIDSGFVLSSYSCANAHYAAPGHVSAGGHTDTGTSFAAPQITAALALLRLDPYHTREEFDACCRPIQKTSIGMPQLDRLAQKSVVSVTMDNVPDQMPLDDFRILQWTVLPRDAADRTVTCVSSDPSVVEIRTNTEGAIQLIAKGAGEATLTLYANSNPQVSDTRRVTVIKRVRTLTLQGPADGIVYMGESVSLTPVFTPSDASIRTLSWTSSAPAVLTVEDGTVAPHGTGSATVTAITEDGSGVQASVTLSVRERPAVETITVTAVNPPAVASVGQTLQLMASVQPELALQEVTWESLFPEIAEISTSGLATFKQAGTAVFSAVSTDGNHVRGHYQIGVKVAVTGVSLDLNTATLAVNETLTLHATVTPSDATDQSVTWSSSKTSVAAVSPTGVVTGKKPGTAVITVRTADGSKTDLCTVTVEGTQYDLIFFPAGGICDETRRVCISGMPIGALPAVERYGYTFDGWFADGNVPVTEYSVFTSTSSVTITAHWSEIFPSSVTLSIDADTLDVGSTAAVTAVVMPANAACKELIWTSNDPSVATVSENGTITGVGPGKTKITAIATAATGVRGSVDITVRQPYTLYLDPNGGTCSRDSLTAYSGLKIRTNADGIYYLPVPEKWSPAGYLYKFKGWYTSPGGGTRVTGSTVFTCSDQLTIYAQWADMGDVIGGYCGVNTTWTLADGRLTISGSGPMDDFDEFGMRKYFHEPYTAAPWHDYMSQITSVTIGSGVTHAGREMCRHAGNLVSAVLPETVTAIGSQAFFYCTSLTSITIPSSVTAIEEDAFDAADSVTFRCESGSAAETFAAAHGISVTGLSVPEAPAVSHRIQPPYLVVQWTAVSGATLYTFQWASGSTTNITA